VRGTVGFARTATDGGRDHGRVTDEGLGEARCAGLTFAAELSVHVPASARCPAGFPGRGGRGRAGAVMAGLPVRESVTLAGRAERARAARTFVSEVLGPGHPCGDVAVLLVREVFGNSVRHSGSGAPGETVTVAVRAGAALSGSRSPIAPGRGRWSCGLRCGRWSGLQLVAGLEACWGWRRRGGRVVTW
jgi:hypothetical protein